jgi:hypothetical protein
MSVRRWLPALLAACCALAPAQAAGQVKLLGTVGLGRPVRSLDGRARALGGAAVVLHGGNLSAVNPASLARVHSSGIWLAYQPESRTLKGDAANGDTETASFPLFRMALPMSTRWVAGVGFGSVLDRNWGVQFTDTLSLTTGDAPFQERRTSDGGVSQFRVESGFIVRPGWTVGAAFQYFFGESRVQVTRIFLQDSLHPDPPQPFVSSTAIRTSGWGLTLGTEYQPVDDFIVGLVATWGSDLTVRDDSTGAEIKVGLPLGLDVGASLVLGADVLFAVAAGWRNWSSAQADLPESGVEDSWRVGGGFELRFLSRGDAWSTFLRLGGSYEKYPFALESAAPWERALALGLGVDFIGGRGRFDAAIEFGGRGDLDTNAVEESFTRYTFSVAVFTN